MFVSVDPSETERQKNLRKSRIKSHASSFVHHRRSRKTFTNTIYTPKTYNEDHNVNSSAYRGTLTSLSKRKGVNVRSRKTLEATNNKEVLHERATAITTVQNKFEADNDGQSALPAPFVSLAVHGGDLTPPETRAIHFFQHRTAQEWCSWGDMHFLAKCVPQVSHQIPALRYAMVSLGAYHEYIERKLFAKPTKARSIALTNANKTLVQFRKDHNILSIGTILMAHVILTLVTSNLNDSGRFRAEYMEYELFDNVKQMVKRKSPLISEEDLHLINNVLIPLIERQDGKEGLYIDAICCLQNTKASEFFTNNVPTAPFFFESIEQAHFVAELLLENAAYIQKISPAPAGHVPEECTFKLSLWKDALEKFSCTKTLNQQEQLSFSILNVAVNFGEMMVAVMNLKDETVFDKYSELFKNLNEVLQESAKFQKQNLMVNVNFGLCAGLLSLASNSVLRWCRDPTLRSRLINTLDKIDRCEGIEGSNVWAHIAKAVQRAEEAALSPPPTSCAEIPEASRVIVNTVSFYATSAMIKLKLWRDPWRTRTVEEIWIPWVGAEHDVAEPLTPIMRQQLKKEMPVTIMGRGYTSRLDQTAGKKYQVRCPRFFFPLPRR